MTALQDFTRDKAWYINNWHEAISGNLRKYDEDSYTYYQRQYKEAMNQGRARCMQGLRRIVIHAFTSLVAHDLDISYGHAQKTIVKAIPEKELAELTARFIEELHDHLGE